MQGGEIFVPKIPSVRIVDLARAMAPDLPIKDIGVRPGEKIHEIMCPKDDSHLTIEYANHYVIIPSISFFSKNYDLTTNKLNEKGEYVKQGTEYDSGTNPHFLSIDEIIDYNNRA
jgi:UDP-N-acetylglucosamine 4,6-dehydratase